MFIVPSLTWFTRSNSLETTAVKRKTQTGTIIFWIIVSNKRVFIIYGGFDPSLDNLSIVVSSSLKNIDCEWVMISCHSLLNSLDLSYLSQFFPEL